jgi:hypothetical protein
MPAAVKYLKGILMTAVSIEAFSHGDGWLSVDTQGWIDDRGEYSDDLTTDFREWMDEHGYARPDDAVIVEWIADRTGEPPAGLHGDGNVWHHNLANFTDHLIDDLGFVALSSGFGDLVITVSDHTGMYVAPTVYRSTVMELADWADYSDAEGECVNGHGWFTHDAAHMHAWDGTDRHAYRISDQIRVPFGDCFRAYVACPECGKSVRFDCHF